MNIAETNGVEIAWESFGNASDEAILLIAGLGTQMIRWTTPFCERIAARGYHVIRFDNRDSGYSTHLTTSMPPDFGVIVSELMAGRRPNVPYSLTDMAEDAIGLADVLGIARLHVVGRSMGGMIAQVMACEYPDRILSLTSIMSSTGNPALPQAVPEVMAMMMQPTPNPNTDHENFLKQSAAFARRISSPRVPFNEAEHRKLVSEETRRAHDPAGTARQIAAMAVAGDRRPRLATIKVPSLVIHGEDDPLIPPPCGVDTAASIPGSQLMLIAGMGHDLPHDLYDAVIDAIERNARQRPQE